MAGLLDQLDEEITKLFSQWNLYTTIIATLLLISVAYPIFFAGEPDTHPLILARQAHVTPVRQPGESATYRSLETPPGYPLKAGLNVKAPGAPRYAAGTDGDLRDIWRQVAAGIISGNGESTGQKLKILSVFGVEDMVEHSISDVSKSINVIGNHFQQKGVKRVAVYLPNSVELLATIFAGAFYGFTVILLPYNQPHQLAVDLLDDAGADALVAQAGSLPLEDTCNGAQAVRTVVWVVESVSRHMDWTGDIETSAGRVAVDAWHLLVEAAQTTSELPSNERSSSGSIVTIWQEQQYSRGQVVEFSPKNIVAAVGAAVTALPPRQRLGPSDLFLPAESLTHSYALVQTLAALFQHSSLALNSVAGPGVNLKLALRGVAPTVVVMSAETAAETHSQTSATVTGGLKKYAHYTQTQALKAGRMPGGSLLTKINTPTRAALGTTPGRLRLLFVAERAAAETPVLSSSALSDLRIYANARVVYALTAAKVAGAITQTNLYDYRREDGPSSKHGHFGVPLSSVEVKLVDSGVHKTTDEGVPKGEIVVSGPAVAGGQVNLGVLGTFREDHTLAYL